MRFPIIRGLIRRRLLVNYRVEADTMQRFLPAPFRPKLHNGFAIAGICLIRLEQIRPSWAPSWSGISSENAAHRIAVTWENSHGKPCEGVFIPRRDTNSWLNYFAGGRIFPGEHRLARFTIFDDQKDISMSIGSHDGRIKVQLRASESSVLPESSCFKSLCESSSFFEGGRLGYSVTRDRCRLDGIRLETTEWSVEPLKVHEVESSFFSNKADFPTGSVIFDHVLIIRNVTHEWHRAADLSIDSFNREASDSAVESCV